MRDRPSIIERAFQIARSGRCASVAQVRTQLASEGYPSAEGVIRGSTLVNRLSVMIMASQAGAAARAAAAAAFERKKRRFVDFIVLQYSTLHPSARA